ncbi:MAG: transporter substrate-binding domain-containing protein [Alphaproteobacteria bacterium]
MERTPFHAILLALVITAGTAQADDAAKKELTSTGKLRVGVVSAPKANVFFVVTDPGGKPRGVTADLGSELARTLDVPAEFTVAHNSGELTDALEKGQIDVAFLPVDEERKKRVAFGPNYVLFESTCLVLGSSSFQTNADLDRPGVKVAGEANTTTFRAATARLKNATVIAVPSVGEAIEMLRNGKVDAFALGREALVPYQAEIPGSRILEGYIHATGIAIAVQKSKPAALAYVSAYLKDAKASGLVRRTFDKAGETSAVAPAD